MKRLFENIIYCGYSILIKYPCSQELTYNNIFNKKTFTKILIPLTHEARY